MTHVFLVSTHGWTGSNWLGFVLDRHPALACSHGVLYERRPTAGDSDEHIWRSGLHALIRERNEQRYLRSLDDVLECIVKLEPGRRCGNVGYFRARDFPILRDRFGVNQRPARLVNLLRHPISTVWSGYGQLQKRFAYDLPELQWNLGKIVRTALPLLQELEERFGVVRGDRDTLAFVSAALALWSLDLDVRALSELTSTSELSVEGCARLEDLTCDPTALIALLAALVPDVPADDQWLEEATSGRRVNVHNRSSSIEDPIAKFEQMTAWQRYTFSWCLARTKIRPFYERYGYELDFAAQEENLAGSGQQV